MLSEKSLETKVVIEKEKKDIYHLLSIQNMHFTQMLKPCLITAYKVKLLSLIPGNGNFKSLSCLFACNYKAIIWLEQNSPDPISPNYHAVSCKKKVSVLMCATFSFLPCTALVFVHLLPAELLAWLSEHSDTGQCLQAPVF